MNTVVEDYNYSIAVRAGAQSARAPALHAGSPHGRN